MVAGGTAISIALTVSGFDLVQHPIAVAAFDQPAAWTVPLAVVTSVVVSLATRSRMRNRADRYVMRLHAPER